MARNFIGVALRRVRAGHHKLIWENPDFQAPENFQLTSASFAHGEPIPTRHAGKHIGDDISPQLTWTTPPAGTVELVLVAQDPDVPLPKPITHAFTLGIGPITGQLPEGALAADSPVPGLKHGKSFGKRGWSGPEPIRSHGPHSYVFQLFALDTTIDVPPGFTNKQARAAIRGHIIGRARLEGTYEVQ
jgi:Raf kinase inhibitor-like YbhB/YbcL family protein